MEFEVKVQDEKKKIEKKKKNPSLLITYVTSRGLSSACATYEV